MKGLIERKLLAISCILLLGLVAIQPIAAANRCPGKQSWPEVVGMKGKKAAAIIEKENKFVRAALVPPTIPTREFRCDRVLVYLDKLGGVVTSTPSVA